MITLNSDIYDKTDLIETINDEYYPDEQIVIQNDGYFWKVKNLVEPAPADAKYVGAVSDLSPEKILP